MNPATRETCPIHIWMHEVITTAGVSVETAERAVSRERLERFYNAGEPVWMAARSVQIMVDNQRIDDRSSHDGRAAIRAAHRASMRRP